jgi:CheY-like chemotaxis protein
MISGTCLFLKYDHKLAEVTIQGRAADYKTRDASLEKIICYSALKKEVISNISGNNSIYSETDANYSHDDNFRIWFVPVKPDPGFPVFAALSGSSLNDFMSDKAVAEEILSSGWFIYEKHLETDKIKALRAQLDSAGEIMANLHQSISKKTKSISGFAALLSEKKDISAEDLKYLRIIQSCCDDINSLTGDSEKLYRQTEVSRNDNMIKSDEPEEIKTILVADNDDINFILVENFLRNCRVKLIRAYNGQEAVNICRSNHVDMVLMDLLMPVMDGFKATEIIKKERPEIKIIAQTAYLNDKERAFDCGCIDLIEKPFRKHQLVSIVNSYL